MARYQVIPRYLGLPGVRISLGDERRVSVEFSQMPPLSKRERSIAAKFRRYESTKYKAKALYDRADAILTGIAQQLEGPKLTKLRAQLADEARKRHLIRISDDGRQLQLRESGPDEKGILGWGHGAVRQFDPKVVNL